MKTTKILAILVLTLGLITCQARVSEAAPMGTAFTYQGRLIDANSAADGLYDFQFKLYNSPDVNLATQLGNTIAINGIDVNDGYFTVQLDFGSNVFNGDAVWLDIGVRPNGGGSFITLSPRQEVTPTPYALQTRGIFVDNNGNVGIGTTNTVSKLDVNGDINTLSLNINGTPISPAADAYTKLLIHADGTDGSATFMDTSAAGNQITANGNARIDAAQSKFGGASGIFDGTGDYLSLADSGDWYFGTEDFTIDFWVRFNSLSGEQVFLSQNEGGSGNFWVTEWTGANLWMSFYKSLAYMGQYVTAIPPSLSINTWYHITFERTGTTAKMFIDGVSQALTENVAFGTNDVGDVSAVLQVGVWRTDADFRWLNGWLDEFRISKGIARWTSYFTPPTRPYADSSSAFAIGSTGKAYYLGKVGIGTTNPQYKLDVEGDVQAYAYHTGDIFFQKDGQKLWRMFEDEDGVYLENLKTGKIYSFVLKETESSDNVNIEQTMRDLRSENEFLKERVDNLERTMQRILLAGAKEVQQ